MNIRRLFGWVTVIALVIALTATHTISFNTGGRTQTLTTAVHSVPFALGPAGSNTNGTMNAEQVVAQVNPAVVTVINEQAASNRSATGNRAPRATATPVAPGTTTPSGNGSTIPVDTGLGSGVIFDDQGDILTNNHVVEGATSLSVELADGTRLPATLVGRDPSQDVAVVRIDPAKSPAVALLGDSSTVRPGQAVLALGSPETLANTVTAGIVSGTNRQIDTYVGLIQTDAAINHGNSGGPLVNMQGEVIGLNTLGLASQGDQGLNFAIPINTAKNVAQSLIGKGTGAVVTTRAYLGISTETLDSSVAQRIGVKATQGAYVSQVQTGTPAAKAGVQKGDVITAVNGTTLTTRTTLGTALNGLKPGDTATLTVDRNGSAQTLSATLAERPANT